MFLRKKQCKKTLQKLCDKKYNSLLNCHKSQSKLGDFSAKIFPFLQTSNVYASQLGILCGGVYGQIKFFRTLAWVEKFHHDEFQEPFPWLNFRPGIVVVAGGTEI